MYGGNFQSVLQIICNSYDFYFIDQPNVVNNIFITICTLLVDYYYAVTPPGVNCENTDCFVTRGCTHALPLASNRLRHICNILICFYMYCRHNI